MAFKDPTRILKTALVAGVRSAAERVLAESNKKVPIDPSRELERSGKVSTDGTRAAISYGRGESADYAVIQHEDRTLRHDPGRSAKYLESSADHSAILNAVADSIRQALR